MAGEITPSADTIPYSVQEHHRGKQRRRGLSRGRSESYLLCGRQCNARSINNLKSGNSLASAQICKSRLPTSWLRDKCLNLRAAHSSSIREAQFFEACRTLTVREIGALPDLDNIAVRIADVATNLAILGDRLGEELGSATFP